MEKDLYIETLNSASVVSVDLVNTISASVIAGVECEEDLNELAISKSLEQQLRTEAFKMAYKDYPIPSYSVPFEQRLEIQNLRNEKVEIYYAKLLKNLT